MNICRQVLVKERNISAVITSWEVFYGEVDVTQDERDRRVRFREKPEVIEVTTEYQQYGLEGCEAGHVAPLADRLYRLFFKRKTKERKKV